MTSFKEVDQVKFELPCTITWGVKKDKYTGYSVSVVLDDDTVEKVEDLAKKHGTKNPLYGNTICIRSKNLSPKQKSELFKKGRCHIEINFTLEGVNTKNDTSYLSFKITKLRKTEDTSESEDPYPED